MPPFLEKIVDGITRFFTRFLPGFLAVGGVVLAENLPADHPARAYLERLLAYIGGRGAQAYELFQDDVRRFRRAIRRVTLSTIVLAIAALFVGATVESRQTKAYLELLILAALGGSYTFVYWRCINPILRIAGAAGIVLSAKQIFTFLRGVDEAVLDLGTQTAPGTYEKALDNVDKGFELAGAALRSGASIVVETALGFARFPSGILAWFGAGCVTLIVVQYWAHRAWFLVSVIVLIAFLAGLIAWKPADRSVLQRRYLRLAGWFLVPGTLVALGWQDLSAYLLMAQNQLGWATLGYNLNTHLGFLANVVFVWSGLELSMYPKLEGVAAGGKTVTSQVPVPVRWFTRVLVLVLFLLTLFSWLVGEQIRNSDLAGALTIIAVSAALVAAIVIGLYRKSVGAGVWACIGVLFIFAILGLVLTRMESRIGGRTSSASAPGDGRGAEQSRVTEPYRPSPAPDAPRPRSIPAPDATTDPTVAHLVVRITPTMQTYPLKAFGKRRFPAGTRLAWQLEPGMRIIPDPDCVTCYVGRCVGAVVESKTGPTIKEVFGRGDRWKSCPLPDGIAGWPVLLTKDGVWPARLQRQEVVLRKRGSVRPEINWPADDVLCSTLKGWIPGRYTPDPWRKSGTGSALVHVWIQLPAESTTSSTEPTKDGSFRSGYLTRGARFFYSHGVLLP